MDTPSPSEHKTRKSTFPLPRLVITLAVVASLAFLLATPGGLLAKADMVGYAVCHRIESHSFVIAGRQLPLCARCSGTFMGALIGFFGQAVVLRRRRASEFPPRLVMIILIGFTLSWACDGLNSYMTLIPNAPYLYQPQNWLRLSTGALNGLTMSALVYPIFNFTLWQDHKAERTIRNLRDLGTLLLLQVGMIGLVLLASSSPLGIILLYPLALLSALGVLTLLVSVNSMLALMLVRRENTVTTWKGAIVPLLAGLTISLIQVGAIDLVRYRLTGTLSGIPLLQ